MALLSSGCAEDPRPRVRVAAGTVVVDTGLAEKLALGFLEAAGTRVEILTVGSGEAFSLARMREVDVLLTHDPEELEGLRAGGVVSDVRPFAFLRYLLVGPVSDPAGVRGTSGLPEGLQRIHDSRARFVSRGDDSGTHRHEMSLWDRLGVEPGGAWYLSSGAGQAETLYAAGELEAYALSDAATFRLMEHRTGLRPLLDPGTDGRFAYEAAAVDSGRHAEAEAFVRWLAGGGAAAVVRAHGWEPAGPVPRGGPR